MPASPRRPGQGVSTTLAPCQGQVPKGILPGPGDDGHPAHLQAWVSHCALQNPSQGGTQAGAGQPKGSRGQGEQEPPRPQTGKRMPPRLWLHLQTLTCSGPHPGKSPGPSQEPELPRPLWCVWLLPVGQASRRCPCPSQGQSSDGWHDDIHPTPAPLPTGASAPDSCYALQPQAQGRELGWSQLQTARPSPQRRLGGGDQRADQLQGGWPQRTKGCRDSGWLRLAQQGHCRW